jgi:hypothetical protein
MYGSDTDASWQKCSASLFKNKTCSYLFLACATQAGAAINRQILCRGLGDVLIYAMLRFVPVLTDRIVKPWSVKRRVPGEHSILIGRFWTKQAAEIEASALQAKTSDPVEAET